MLARPTFRNLTGSYETWAYRKGFRRQVRSLARQKLVEIGPSTRAAPVAADRVLRLTAAGRLVALGGRDPQSAWNEAWDGRWRLVLFDLPATAGTIRNRLRNALRGRGWGWLQNSAWISPRPLVDQEELLAGSRVNVESIVAFEGRPCTGETDQEIVEGAWDFRQINRRYARCLEVLKSRPKKWPRDLATDEVLRAWIGREREAWLAAVSADPLLPERLLPEGYLGQEVWKQRLHSYVSFVPAVAHTRDRVPSWLRGGHAEELAEDGSIDGDDRFEDATGDDACGD